MKKRTQTEVHKEFPPVVKRYDDPMTYPTGIAYMDGHVLMSEAKVSMLETLHVR